MNKQVDEFTLRRIKEFARAFVNIYVANPPNPNAIEAGSWARENIPEEFFTGDEHAALQGFIHEFLTEEGWEVQEATKH